MEYRVYIVRNSEGRLYIGLSEDVIVRLADHNSGVSKWTKHRGPWELIWQSAPQDITSARKFENLLKRQKGGGGLYRLTGLPQPGQGDSSGT
ncbi:GIY-YIG nuclease family protein [Verrucomicrobium sp. BvORR034]|uniref:GIY-YIG nuclease family protein n=1 Tax=Verrucomicrobium sp. BvORR034 TaxID=1396418 RepID=UPI0006789DAB|nr:GIY-YIG nuclease family protein [Verrucomicrobium sp. BvORR034]